MFKTNENGRSMVEMLGVLAIVGVLSVTGIIGYTIAMRKYRANEIAQAISSMAIAAKTANGGQGIRGDKEFDKLMHRDAPIGVGSLIAKATTGDNPKFANEIELVIENNNENLCIEVASIIGDSNKNALYIENGNDKCTAGASLTVTVTD